LFIYSKNSNVTKLIYKESRITYKQH